MRKSFNFNEMTAFEFSALSKNTPDSISMVTVLDCKHCNDPAPCDMKSLNTYAQQVILREVVAKTMSSGIVCTYTDTGYNDCDGSYYDTDD